MSKNVGMNFISNQSQEARLFKVDSYIIMDTNNFFLIIY